MRVRGPATAAAVVLLAACAGDGSGLDENGRPIGSAPAAPLSSDFSSIQSNVLTPICTTCHSGAAAPLGLRLDEGAAYAMLVNAPSVEVPELNRVTPGNPDASYLIQKLEGTARVGSRMPFGNPPLPAETINVIRQWIADGAQAPAVAATSSKGEMKAAQLQALWPISGSVLRESPREIVLSANREIDTTLLNAGTVSLRRSGSDGNFTGDEAQVLHPVFTVRVLDPTVIVLQAPAPEWVAGHYELRISAGPPLALADRASQPIDGDGNGEPGGDFVLRFELEAVQ
jgi:hypothetical protein